MIKFILLGILLVFTVHQAFAQNVTMTTDSSDYYFLIGDDVAVGAMVNSSFPNTLTGNIEYTTVVTVRQPGMQTVNTNVGNSPVTINPGVEQLLIQFGSYQTETTLQTTLHVTYSDVEQYELVHDFTVHIVADDSQKNNQNDPSQSSSQQQQSQQQQSQQQQQFDMSHNCINSCSNTRIDCYWRITNIGIYCLHTWLSYRNDCRVFNIPSKCIWKTTVYHGPNGYIITDKKIIFRAICRHCNILSKCLMYGKY